MSRDRPEPPKQDARRQKVAPPQRGDVRRRLLQVALDYAQKKGFDATSYRDLAEALNITAAAVYYHFRSKDALLLALVGAPLEAMEALAADGEHGQLRGGAQELLERYLDILIVHRDAASLMVRDISVINHPALDGRVENAQRRLRLLLTGAAADANATARAAAALGALRRPILVLPVEELDQARPVLVSAALAALGADADTTPDGVARWRSDYVGDERHLVVPAEPFAAAASRHFVAEVLNEWGLVHLAGRAVLLANELVTNAIVHARTDIRLTIRRNPALPGNKQDCVRVEVADSDDRLPVAKAAETTAVAGYGFELVDALAQAWGMHRQEDFTKVIWFELHKGRPSE